MKRYIYLIVSALIAFVACELDHPTGLNNESVDSENVTLQTEIGTVTPLLKQKQYLVLNKFDGSDSTFVKQKFVETTGGRIKVGNRDYGKSKVVFRKRGLESNTYINFTFAATNTFEAWVSSPDYDYNKIPLNKRIKLILSYRTADLKRINEKDLRIFWYDNMQDQWILIGGMVNKKNKTILVNVKKTGHFIIADANGNAIGHPVLDQGSGADLADQDLTAISFNVFTDYNEKIDVKEFVSWKDGGDLKIDFKAKDYNYENEDLKCQVTLKVFQETISQDTELKLDLSLGNISGNVDVTFHPHGITFSEAALLNIDAEALDLAGINPEDIALYYDNPETGEWELMEIKEIQINLEQGKVKIIDAKLPHFSRYAMAYGK